MRTTGDIFDGNLRVLDESGSEVAIFIEGAWHSALVAPTTDEFDDVVDEIRSVDQILQEEHGLLAAVPGLLDPEFDPPVHTPKNGTWVTPEAI